MDLLYFVLAVRFLYHADDLRQDGVVAHLLSPELKAAFLVERSGKDPLTSFFSTGTGSPLIMLSFTFVAVQN